MSWTTGQCATLACLLEATAPKPGNVHRGADFADMSYLDLVSSGVAIAPAMDAAVGRRLGETVLTAVRATRTVAPSNTNLGIILLLSPLAAVPTDMPLPSGVQRVLATLNVSDAADVFTGICEARPGGLGSVAQADVAGSPPDDLVGAMRLAADRDLVARQYANDYAEVFGHVVPALQKSLDRHQVLSAAIVQTQLRLMRDFPDSLIIRKCGPEIAQEASDRAAQVLSSGQPGDEAYERGLADLDFWLRADRHRRNPGTTADLICAGLFVLLREGKLAGPWQFYDPNAL